MIPQRVRTAIFIAFVCHGLFILTARYRLSYDAYTHMLFANHYAENWFSLWETRWYTGFTVVSYPPLIHQLIALFVPVFGLEPAFAFILWMVTTLLPLGIYAFSTIFIGKAAASYAALASAILLPIYVVAHIFGQLPFLASTLLALFEAASLNRYLREGGTHNLLLTVSLATTTMASHHATLLLQPFLMFAVFISNLFRDRDETLRFQILKLLARFSLFAGFAAITSVIVIWPFWEWGMHQSMQTPIDHLSRHNFFRDPLAFLIFFWPLYGPLVLIIPFLFRPWPLRFTGLIISFAILLVLGLGGTTSLPLLLFGTSWEWLTYDRFAFWACLTLTPFFGIVFLQLRRRWRNHFISNPVFFELLKNSFSAITFSIFAVTSLGAWLTPLLFQIQPGPIGMKPIVDFLDRSDRSQWRYLTFGFGDQFAYLNLLTKATTIDGSYHTARTLPELRESGIGQVDTVYWALKGIPAIGPILQKSGEYGVRWGFVNRKEFIPELKKARWRYLNTLSNGIQVWENPKAVLPKPSKPPIDPPINSFSWSVLPILSFVTTTALGMLHLWPVQAEKALRRVYAFVVGLIPLSLCFWYFRMIVEFPHDRVYFTYDSALFFLSDALVLLAVILWICTRIPRPPQLSFTKRELLYSSSFLLLLFMLIVLSFFSIIWSSDHRTSLYLCLHSLLVFLFILSLREWHYAWRPLIYGFCAALAFQFITAFVGFALQSTAFLDPLEMKWPGVLDPSMRGVSVVQLSDGLRVLRAYGTLPHPNILGGFAFVSLIGPASLILENERPNLPILILFAFSTALLALTFSRSAWLGLIVFSLVLILKLRYLNRKHLVVLLITAIMGFATTLLIYHQLLQVRTLNIASNSEKISFLGRIWLSQEAIQMIHEHPLTGVGIGSFIIELARRADEGYPIEPVHNIPLLVIAELGIGGLILIMFLSISISLNIIRVQTWKAILVSAVMAGLGTISLFDHYFWSLAPGRLMVALVFGLWAGQVTDNDL